MGNIDLVTIPGSEQQLDLSKPEDATTALTLTRYWREELNSFQAQARATLRMMADTVGQRTFVVNGHKVTVDNPAWDRQYDVAKLHEELTEAGLDAQRLSELITWEPKVDGKIIRELEHHPRYKAAIDKAITSVTEKTRTVKVD